MLPFPIWVSDRFFFFFFFLIISAKRRFSLKWTEAAVRKLRRRWRQRRCRLSGNLPRFLESERLVKKYRKVRYDLWLGFWFCVVGLLIVDCGFNCPFFFGVISVRLLLYFRARLIWFQFDDSNVYVSLNSVWFGFF